MCRVMLLYVYALVRYHPDLGPAMAELIIIIIIICDKNYILIMKIIDVMIHRIFYV